jgi:death-on-curing protein
MSNVKFLDADDIRYLHEDAIEEFGGIYGENESGMIDYMAEKPFQIVFGQERFPTLFQKASVYLHGFAINQYFCDGNKRTGIKCCLTFLAINGYDLTVDDIKLYQFTIDVANNKFEFNEIIEWLKKNSCINLSYL